MFINRPIPGPKKKVKMEIKIKSLKFDADERLIGYAEKKVARLEKFFDNSGVAELTLSLLHEPENKNAQLKLHIPGEDLVIERQAKTFEEAVTECVDLMKEKLTRAVEKRFDKRFSGFPSLIYGEIRSPFRRHPVRQSD